MNYSKLKRYQSAFREFADISDWHSPHAFTLTMKQGIRPPFEPASATEYLTREKASQNFRHFMNLMNKRVFGKAASHHGKRLPVIPVIEGGSEKRLHYHGVIDCPRDDLIGLLPMIVRSTWAKTKWAWNEIDIQPDADRGWINYISKTNDKPDYANAIDWENFKPLDCRV